MKTLSTRTMIKLVYLYTGAPDDAYVEGLLDRATNNPDHFKRRYHEYKSKPYSGLTATPSGIALSRTILTMDDDNLNRVSEFLFTDHEA
jgi:hypothetical protein